MQDFASILKPSDISANGSLLTPKSVIMCEKGTNDVLCFHSDTQEYKNFIIPKIIELAKQVHPGYLSSTTYIPFPNF